MGTIGDNVSIGENTPIYSSKNESVTIGSNVQIAAQRYIIDMNYGIVDPIKIKDDVCIVAGAKILQGSVLEQSNVMGAQSVVKGYIPSNAFAIGVPAKVKMYRE